MVVWNKKLVGPTADEEARAAIMEEWNQTGGEPPAELSDKPFTADGVTVMGPSEPSDITMLTRNDQPDGAALDFEDPTTSVVAAAREKVTGAPKPAAMKPKAAGKAPAKAAAPAPVLPPAPAPVSAPPSMPAPSPRARTAPGQDAELGQLQAQAAARRKQNAVSSAVSYLSHAGIDQPKDRAAWDQRMDAEANQPVADLGARRGEASRQLKEQQGTESHELGQETGRQSLTKQYEEMVRQRDYNAEQSEVSRRRRAEAFGLYPKEIARIPADVWAKASAADVDVVLKELAQQRASSGSGFSAFDRFFASQVQNLGKETAKLPYGEVDRIASELEALAPGITSGNYKGPDPLGGVGDRVLNVLPGQMGERFMGDRSLRAAKVVDEVKDLLSRLRSGAVLSPSEEAHYLKLIGGGPTQDERSLSLGLKTVLDSVRAKLRNAQSGYNYIRNDRGQTPLDVVSGQGGTDSRQNPPSAPPPPPLLQRPKGQPYKGPDGHWYIDEG